MLSAPWEKLHIEKGIACEFFAVFSRFEFALKAAGFSKPNGSDFVSPDWLKFADSVSDCWSVHPSTQLGAAVSYLLSSPPSRQKLTAQSTLAWSPLTLADTEPEAKRLVRCIKCVRNNLFHGGKFLAQPIGDPERDLRLVTASLEVLGALVALNANVRSAYES